MRKQADARSAWLMMTPELREKVSSGHVQVQKAQRKGLLSRALHRR